MIKVNDSVYKAEEGCLIVRKADDFIMGDAIDLGSADNIENYESREFTQEQIDEFNQTYGIEKKVEKEEKVTEEEK